MLTGSFAGMWWRPDDADHRVAGVLEVAYEELALDLIGSFESIEVVGRVRGYPVLHGISTGGLFFTLIDVTVGDEGLNFADLDVRATRLLPSSILVGAHIVEPVGARWAVASIELERMTAWASPPGFERSLDISKEHHLEGANFRYEVPAAVEAAIPGASLLIGTGQRTTGDMLHEAGLTVAVEAVFTFDEPKTIDEISQRFLKPLLNLVVLATQKPTAIVSFRLAAAPEIPRRWVEVIQRRPGPSDEQRKRLFPGDALFLLPDLLDTSPDALAQWFIAATALERPFELVAAVHGAPRLFLDHRFINVATATESYHEERFDGQVAADDVWQRIVDGAVGAAPSELAEQVRNRVAGMKKPSFQDRISDLLLKGGDSLRALLPDPDGIAKHAGGIRNPLAHGVAAKATWRQIFDTTDELLLILEFHFLNEAGFSPDQAAERLRLGSRSYSGLWLRRRDDEATADGTAARKSSGSVPPG